VSLLPQSALHDAITSTRSVRLVGRVTRVAGLLVDGTLPGAHLGMVCRLRVPGAAHNGIPAEVVALRERSVSLMPLGGVAGIQTGTEILTTGEQPSVRVGNGLLGRVLDGWGNPLDGKGKLTARAAPSRYPLDPAPLNPLLRAEVAEPLSLGVRAIDGMLTCGQGQRMAILAGAGVGKSTLLAMMVKRSAADVIVVGLVGERGREVKRFVDHDLGPEGMQRAVLVAATSDHAPALRVRAARVATSIAEYFRDQGKRVLLLIDSLSRVAMAQRELGLAVGEPPATKGYPPSAFAIIPRLLERAGPGLIPKTGVAGSITALYTTLLEGDDLGDPIGDAVKATTDGHIVLSRKLADRGHFPAIDILGSTSRVMGELVSDEHKADAVAMRRLMADHRAVHDLAVMGAYSHGSNADYDRALAAWPDVEGWLTQGSSEAITLSRSAQGLQALVAQHPGAKKPSRQTRSAS
jgi:FliI/YscN family ATPase